MISSKKKIDCCQYPPFTGTFQRDWHGFPATGKPVEFNVAIFFPWDPEKKKFKGERVLTDATLNLLKV